MSCLTYSGSGVEKLVPAGFFAIRFSGVASATATKMKIPWMANSEHVQSLLLVTPRGVRNFETWKVAIAPMRKVMSETRVASQAYGIEGRPAVERPRITVLPGKDVSMSKALLEGMTR